MIYNRYNIKYFDEQYDETINFINLHELIKISYDEIKVGDKIVINYYPELQKYIYKLYTKYGIVTKIDSTTRDYDYLTYIKLANKNNSYTASHGQVGMYSRGYDYNIYKLKT